MDENEQAVIDRAIERLRAGETLEGSFMYEHGLETPFVACGSVRRAEQGEGFVYTSWQEEPVVPVVRTGESSRVLDEAGVRTLLASDRPLRAALGLR